MTGNVLFAPALLGSGLLPFVLRQAAARVFDRRLLWCNLVLLLVFSSAAAFASTHVLIATSASGDEHFKEQFWSWTSRLYRALTTQSDGGVCCLLLEDPAKGQSLVQENGNEPGAAVAKATRAEFLKAGERLRTSVRNGDTVIIVLLGHGSFDGADYKFNLVGPDLTGNELGRMLDQFSAQQVVLVAATPASGLLPRTLAHKNRVVIAATRSEMENNDTVFGGFFIEALEGQAADTDKNGQVSVLEAYLYAQKKVEASYKERQKLATEHPVLEDDGNGRASSVPGPANGDGLLAARITLTGKSQLSAKQAQTTEGGHEATGLLEEKKRIEAGIEELKYRKASLPEADYQKRLEKLLVELARVDARIRNLEKEH